MSARRRWAAAALLVLVGWSASPGAVPIYDGVSAPDEPYRYVAAPPGAKVTPGVTTAFAQSPVKQGVNTNGLSVVTSEQGPQFSLFVPPKAAAATGSTLEVRGEPQAPSDQPAGAVIDGNVYAVTLKAGPDPVTLTAKAAIATLYLRATSQRQPGPTMYYRADPGGTWAAQKTSRGGFDIYVATFAGAGQYALAFPPQKAKDGGVPVLPIVLVVVFVLLVGAVLVVRLRAKEE